MRWPQREIDMIESPAYRPYWVLENNPDIHQITFLQAKWVTHLIDQAASGGEFRLRARKHAGIRHRFGSR